MLVLTRRVGERLRIGADIELVVLDVRAREVRLGVTAPASVAIHREEVYLKVQGTVLRRPAQKTRPAPKGRSKEKDEQTRSPKADRRTWTRPRRRSAS